MRIHSGNGFDIFRHDGTSPYLLVTFNEVGRLGDGDYYWGRPTVEAKSISAIGIASRKADWFRNPEIDTFLKANQRLFRPLGEVVTAGYSMGGYGAIKYSRMVGATTVIAFCAQYTMDPAITLGRDSRAPHKLFDPVLHKDMEPVASELSGRIYMFHDPHFADDVFHVEKMCGTGHVAVCPVAVPFADHEANRVFSTVGDFAGLIDVCRAGDFGRIRAYVADVRRRWRPRPAKTAIAAAGKRPDLALAIFRKHEAAFRAVDMGVLGAALARTRPRIAETLLRKALAADPKLMPLFQEVLGALSGHGGWPPGSDDAGGRRLLSR